MVKKQNNKDNMDKKQEQLDQFRTDDSKGSLTTNQGLKMAEDEHSLKAGVITEKDSFAEDFIEAIAIDRHRERKIEEF